MAEWSFLTNHARALLYIARDSEARLRDLAALLEGARDGHGRDAGPFGDVGHGRHFCLPPGLQVLDRLSRQLNVLLKFLNGRRLDAAFAGDALSSVIDISGAWQSLRRGGVNVRRL